MCAKAQATGQVQHRTDWLQSFWLACLAPNSGCSTWTQGQELVLYLLDFDFCPCACHRDEDKQNAVQ